MKMGKTQEYEVKSLEESVSLVAKWTMEITQNYTEMRYIKTILIIKTNMNINPVKKIIIIIIHRHLIHIKKEQLQVLLSQNEVMIGMMNQNPISRFNIRIIRYICEYDEMYLLNEVP